MPASARTNPARTGLPHARRVGAARGHMARLAAQSRRLARQIPAHPLGLRGDRAPARRARESVTSSSKTRRPRGARRILKRAGANLDQVSFHAWPTDRSWTRDSGPIFVRNREGQLALTNWHFNAWAKYSNWQLDDQVPGRVAACWHLPSGSRRSRLTDTPHRMVLEGGSIDTNGAGICSPPRSASSAKCSSAIPASAARNWSRPSTTISASIRFSGSAAASPATTPTATSTTSAASLAHDHRDRRRAEHQRPQPRAAGRES
jgi:hypothetical protein